MRNCIFVSSLFVLVCFFSATPAHASANLTISSASLAGDGKTLTVAVSGVSGSLSPTSGITGFKVWDANNIYYPIAATSSGSTVTLRLGFPIASGATVTIDLAASSGSNLTDTGADTPTGQTGYVVTNNSTMSILAVPFSNTNLKWSGSWTTQSWTGGRNVVRDDAGGSQLDFNFTGTDVAIVNWEGSTGSIGTVQVDGGGASNINGLGNDFADYDVVPIASGLSSGGHSVTFKPIGGAGQYFDNGTNSSSGNATLLIASASAPAVAAPAGSWGIQNLISGPNVSAEGLSISGSNYGGSPWYELAAGQGARFTSSSSFIAIWGFNQGGDVDLFQDGVLIATVFNAVPSNTWGRQLLASGLDTTANHEYYIVGGAATSVGGGAGDVLLWSIETDSGSLKAVPHSSLPVDTFFGDSITFDLMVNDFSQGDQWLTTQAIGHSMNRKGYPSATVATGGLPNVSNIPASSTSVWIRFGFNDAYTTVPIGSVGTPGTFIGDYYTLIGDIRSRIGSGKKIYLEGIFPTSSLSNRQTYNTAIQSVLSSYETNNPSDTAVSYISTDGWLNPSTDTVDGIHPNVSGYTKMANNEIPFASSTGYVVSGPVSGTSSQASTNFTVTIASGATFTGTTTITMSDGGNGGTFTPSVGTANTSSVTVTPVANTTAFTFTYTPASSGTKTLTFTNGPGWTDPSAIVYTATSSIPPVPPSVTSQAPSSTTATSTIFNGNITSIGGATVTVRGFEYGTTTSYGTLASTSGSYGTGAFTMNIGNLACTMTYHYRAFAINAGGISSSTDQTFTSGSAGCLTTLPYDDSNLSPAGDQSLTAMPVGLGIFDVKQYGAAGNGTTDDTVAIRNAISAANMVGGGIIFFPSGTYAVDRQPGDAAWPTFPTIFTITSNNMVFLGEGTSTTHLVGYMPGLTDPKTNWVVTGDGYFRIARFNMFQITSSGAGSIQFRSLDINGQAGWTGNGAVGGDPTTGDGWDLTHKGINIAGAIGSVLIFNSDIHDWRGEIIYSSVNGGTAINVINDHIYGSDGDGISVGNVFVDHTLIGGTTTGNDIQDNGIEDFSFDGQSTVVHNSQITVCSSSTSIRTANNGIAYLGKANGALTVENSLISQNNFGILFSESAHNVTIQDNTFSNNEGSMIDSILDQYGNQFPVGFSDFLIANNTFDHSGFVFSDQDAEAGATGLFNNLVFRNNTVTNGWFLSGPFTSATSGIPWNGFVIDGTILGTGASDFLNLGYSGMNVALWTNTVRSSLSYTDGQVGVRYNDYSNSTSTMVMPISDVTALNDNQTIGTHYAVMASSTLWSYPVGFQTTFIQEDILHIDPNAKFNWSLKADPSWNTFSSDIPVGQDGVTVVMNNSGKFVLVSTPTLSTVPATGVSISDATLNGFIVTVGPTPVTQSGFAYGTSPTLTTGTATTTLGAQVSNTSFNQSIAGLAPATTYYFRAYAANSAGTTTGSIYSFTTTGTPIYTVGGSISGLTGTVILQDNATDNQSISANGSFTFATAIPNASTYVVTVLSQPSGQTCSVSSGSGVVSSSNVTSVSLTCTTNAGTPPLVYSSGGGGGSLPISNAPPTSTASTTSIINVVTTNVCTTPVYPLITKNLSQGTSGNDVLLLQKILVAEGFMSASSVTSIYGPLTVAAVSSFQKKYAIVSVGTPTTTGFGSVGPKTRTLINQFISGNKYPTLGQCLAKSSTTSGVSTTTARYVFTHPLSLGSISSDVKALQIFLNTHGFVIAPKGNGSPGLESTYFGTMTKAALIKFQNYYATTVLAPLGMTVGTGYFGPSTMKEVNKLMITK